VTREEFLQQLPELVKNYKPATDVVKHVADLNLLMVVGPSGSGKTTLMRKIGLRYVVPETTRAPRANEQEGVDFVFRTDYSRIVEDIKNGQYVQVVVDSGGDLKATRSDAYPKGGDVMMAVVAEAVPAFRQLGFKNTISAFITPPSYSEWQTRIGAHHLSKDQEIKRLEEAERSLIFALSDDQMHFILNDEVESAADQLKKLFEGQVDIARETEAKEKAQYLLSQSKIAQS
jgi:guanylate kinase